MDQPPQVFISYSHQDKKWLMRLQVHLTPLVPSVWDDTRIQAGGDWRAEIETALRSARVAVLLISPDFLASDFIAETELPALLEAAEQRGTKILPLILFPSRFADPKLSRFQSINDPKRPLARLRTWAQRDEILVEVPEARERPVEDLVCYER